MDWNLHGKVVVGTGGRRRIGESICMAFPRRVAT